MYDEETGLYYLQSRYYDPEICRFINADIYPTTGQGLTGNNMFAYCGNNPVDRKDTTGTIWETVFDVLSLGASVVEVALNPTDPWAWAGLVGDAVDLIPFVTGVGEVTRAVKVTSQVVENVDNVVDAAKALKRSSNAADNIKKATGTYEILYSSGKNYVGKGGFDRAIKSAVDHAKPNKMNNMLGDTVVSIKWKASKNHVSAFVEEYALQTIRGVNNPTTYNKIWSPGKKLFMK